MEPIDIFDVLTNSSTVYHYTTANVALENILPYSKLRLTPLALTNDPLEYKELLFMSLGWGDFLDKENKITQAMYKVNSIRREKYQMIAFSFNQTTSIPSHRDSLIDQYELLGCCKPRMWSQYGENHRGVVLALDLNKILNGTNDQLKKENRTHSNPMTYELINIKSKVVLDSNEIFASDIDDYCERFIERNIEELFFYKHPDYKDENEYRIIVNAISTDRVFINIKDSILAVIIGDRFPDGLLPSLKYLCKKLDVTCKRISWESGQPILFDCLPLDYQLHKDWTDL